MCATFTKINNYLIKIKLLKLYDKLNKLYSLDINFLINGLLREKNIKLIRF